MADGETKRVLIVDDDMSVLRIMRDALQRYASLGSGYFPEAGIWL
jgi:hypothetical protein